MKKTTTGLSDARKWLNGDVVRVRINGTDALAFVWGVDEGYLLCLGISRPRANRTARARRPRALYRSDVILTEEECAACGLPPGAVIRAGADLTWASATKSVPIGRSPAELITRVVAARARERATQEHEDRLSFFMPLPAQRKK